MIISVQDSKESSGGRGGWRGIVRKGAGSRESGNQGTSKAAREEPSLPPSVLLALVHLGGC